MFFIKNTQLIMLPGLVLTKSSSLKVGLEAREEGYCSVRFDILDCSKPFSLYLQSRIYSIRGRFWWTESPPKSAQKSTRESRSTQKRALESKCTRLSAQKSAQTSSTAQTRAQRIALKSKSLKRVLKRVRYSIKCSGEWVNKKREPLKRVRYS